MSFRPAPEEARRERVGKFSSPFGPKPEVQRSPDGPVIIRQRGFAAISCPLSEAVDVARRILEIEEADRGQLTVWRLADDGRGMSNL